jgi:uncharacterized membrane protein YjgN (DUF898 family)
VYLAALGLLLALIAGALLLVAPLLMGAASGAGNTSSAIGLMLGMFVAMAMYVFASVAMWAFTTARIQNLAWNHTQLGPHRFVSTIEASRLVVITVTNLLAMVATLGLFKPFAEVRVTEYLLSACTVMVSGNLNDFVAGERLEIGATGEEAVEMFDIDLAI